MLRSAIWSVFFIIYKIWRYDLLPMFSVLIWEIWNNATKNPSSVVTKLQCLNVHILNSSKHMHSFKSENKLIVIRYVCKKIRGLRLSMFSLHQNSSYKLAFCNRKRTSHWISNISNFIEFELHTKGLNCISHIRLKSVWFIKYIPHAWMASPIRMMKLISIWNIQRMCAIIKISFMFCFSLF